ncbi:MULTISPECIES: response regulator [Paenibacillus]|uniref:Histidine kinase n=1 Tax=Paenibacillus naphthalenovorans TaxID=162209 RepID=A0A0U2INW2_9BACL|nr:MULTISPECIES: response regulator [Paenibacillus]ALS25419.1 histidine kinase [Paenibacillus naphthalenovorans]NTZ16192.1 response regulator [Paenibacillus sp. JMULE4]GCL74320.1 DNA-binding protein [Paenibacillus naphthalenovorans]SDJ17114.1 two-component system, response regulator YcbB [Paenibacillus naphthalenovorans]
MLKFYLVDDDPAVRKMISRIIRESGLGEVTGESDDGAQTSREDIRDAQIVIIDLLMPGRDGIETVKALREEGYEGRFIMISQVENKEMIGEAYQQGVDTFIQKPINRLEVLAVLRRVSDHLLLEKSMQTIRQSLSLLETSGIADSKGKTAERKEKSIEEQARSLLPLLGIAGEAGASDLIHIVGWLKEQEQDGNMLPDLPPLKTIYEQVAKKNSQHPDASMLKDVRALEQRVRRLALQSLTHLSSLGLNDYGNPTFEYFASRLFDFQEVRNRMRELEEDSKTSSSKLNIRKFLYVFYMEARSPSH